jgi:hypothetical protein
MAENTLDIGEAISWINLVFILGRMDACMKASIKMIKNMDMVFTHGQTQKDMQVGGVMENNTDLEFLYQRMERRSWGFGKTVQN